MSAKTKGAGLRTRAPFNTDLHLTARLARTKRILVGAYGLNALTFTEAELIASRLRRCYGPAWRAA